MTNREAALQALKEITIWLIEVVVIPLVVPVVVSAGLLYIPNPLVQPDTARPGLESWAAVFGSAEILFLGLISGSVALLDYFRSTISLDRGRRWLNVSASLCSLSFLITAITYSAFVTERVLAYPKPVSVNPLAPEPVLLTAVLVTFSATTYFFLRYFEYAASSSAS
jgi:hypothetical protein